MLYKSILRACSIRTTGLVLPILLFAGFTFPLTVLADMLPPNWDKMSGKEKDAYYKAKAEQRQRLREMYDLKNQVQPLGQSTKTTSEAQKKTQPVLEKLKKQ